MIKHKPECYTPWEAESCTPKPVPSSPTHCRSCGVELPVLRRWGGECEACVRCRATSRSKPKGPPPDKLVTRLVVVRLLYRERGHHGQTRRERYVEVRCACGRKCTMAWARWQHHRPLSCNKCRLSGIAARGFEAEYAR